MLPLRGSALLFRPALLAAAILRCACPLTRELVSSTYDVVTHLNPSDPERASAPHGIEIACSRGTLNYLVPVEGGVVLVDAGYDEQGRALLEAIGERKVLAVLLTHGHIDHRAAAHLFDAPVYVGRGDLPTFFEDPLEAPALILAKTFLGRPPAPKDLRPVDDKEVLEIGGARFVAIALPGHTPGSTAWLYRDVLFTGDAAQAPLGDHVYPAPWEVSKDRREAWRSLKKLLDVPFSVMLDGHFGRLDDPKPRIVKAIRRAREEGPSLYPLFRPSGCAPPSSAERLQPSVIFFTSSARLSSLFSMPSPTLKRA